MPKVIVSPGKIVVLEPVSPYDDFVRAFLATMHDVRGVLISGYPAILLGRSRQTEDIDMFLEPIDRDRFNAWWDRLEAGGFWCINAGRGGAWDMLQEHLAPRFARAATIEPNMEVKVPRDEGGREALRRAWRLDLMGVEGAIGDLADQVAYKLYMATADGDGTGLPDNKDFEDALHVAKVAAHAIDRARFEQRVSILRVPRKQVEAFIARAGWV